MQQGSGAWPATMRWLLILSWLLCAAAAAQSPSAAVIRLTQGEFAHGDGPAPPAAGWAPMVLPDIFVDPMQATGRIGWYRLSFDLAAPPAQPLVLLVQRVVTTAEFRLNGSLLNADVHFAQAGGRAGTQMSNWPHWFVLPTGLLHAGRNELLIRLAGDAVTPAWVSGISIGPAAALRGEYLLRDIPQRRVPQALAVLMLASLPFVLRVWWRARHPLQLQLVATATLWLALIVLYLFPDWPLPRTVLATGIVSLWVAFHWALLSLLWRLSGSPWAWFPRALAVGSALPLAAALAVLWFEPSQALLAALMLPTTVLRLLTTAMLVQWAWRERSWPAALLTGAELLWFAGPLQSMLVGLDLLQPDPFMLTPGNALPLYVVLLAMAAQRLVRQREEAARQRLAAVMAERQRMMLDMHDGMGAHLVTAVRLARRDDVPRAVVGQLVEEALHDLRLIIDSLDPDAHALQPLLGQWRHRVQPQLQALGQRLAWDVDELAPYPLSPADALDVLRFVQEALNNALRHAGARTIGIGLAATQGGCELRVFDDGVGIDPGHLHAVGAGRGLDSLRRRAQRLGAQCEVRPGAEGGTVVSLRLPPARVRA